jgi:membrane protease YdiL (CAAX protease family)
MGTAGGLLGSSLLLASAATIPGSQDSLGITSLVTFQATWSYGLYAAYRDVRKYNGQIGYSYKMPTDSFSDLAYAPFRFSVLKKPEVWGGFLGAFALATATAYFAFPGEAHIELSSSPTLHLSSIAALPIGIGEESMFRGFLQSALLEFIPPWAGIALSSLSFGAAHIPNAMALPKEDRWRYYTFSLPLITGMGAYFGWLTYKNRSLQESVAIHTWYDFVLLAASSFANTAAATGRPGFALAIPF